MLDSMQHLQKTNDRPIDEGQDDEQDAKDDEDNASDVDSSILQSSRSYLNPIRTRLAKKMLSNASSTFNTISPCPPISSSIN